MYVLLLMFHSTVSIHPSLIAISIRHAHDGTVDNISYLVQHDAITGDRRTAPSLPSFYILRKSGISRTFGSLRISAAEIQRHDSRSDFVTGGFCL